MADSKTKVRRIKADDSKKKAPRTTQKVVKKGSTKDSKKFNAPKWLKVVGKPFFAIGRYVNGAWQELRMTKWPNRRATWSLTLAVIIFSIFFATLILLADYGFDWLIKEIVL